MFGRFFSALSSLTASVNSLAASFTEANIRLRQNLALDHAEDVAALPAPILPTPISPSPEDAADDNTPEDKPARRNGRTRATA